MPALPTCTNAAPRRRHAGPGWRRRLQARWRRVQTAGWRRLPVLLVLPVLPVLPVLSGLCAVAVAGAAAAATPAASAATSTHAAGVASPATQRFSVHGLGRVQAGQSLAQAQWALGEPLLADGPAAAAPAAASAGAAGASGCRYHRAAGQPGLRFVVNQGVLSRVETRDPRYTSLSGVAVGQSLAQARRAYGARLVAQSHPYFDRGQLLLVHAADRRSALVMESNNDGRIITLRSGRLPDVHWLEGCS